MDECDRIILHMFIEIALIAVFILLNGYFSLSEIALLSVKKSKIKHLSKLGDKKAQKVLLLTRQSSEMLSTIQIGITLVGIFAGAYGSATIAEDLEQVLAEVSFISSYSEPVSVALVVIVITFFSLVIGELVPKHIALSHPEKFSLAVAGPVRWMMQVVAPFAKTLSACTRVVLGVLHIQPAAEQVITEEEIKLLIAEGAESGVFEISEQKMVESIFHLGNRPIKDFMTSRKEVVWLDVHDSLSEIRDKIVNNDRSVFPVCDGQLDNAIGAVETKDILIHLFDKGAEYIDLELLIQPVIRIDAEVPSLVAIERLKRSSISIVLITEKESKKIMGIISFHDILEAIVGEFKSV